MATRTVRMGQLRRVSVTSSVLVMEVSSVEGQTGLVCMTQDIRVSESSQLCNMLVSEPNFCQLKTFNTSNIVLGLVLRFRNGV